MKALIEHHRACNSSGCVCSALLSVLQKATASGWSNWLDWEITEGAPVRWRCATCAECDSLRQRAGTFAEWRGDSSGLCVQSLTRHAASRGHRQACGDQLPTVDPVESPAPTASALGSVLEAIRQGAAPSTGLQTSQGIFGPGKARQMVWCLMEAQRQQVRDQLAKCVVGSLLRDERHGRLHVRFHGSTSDMEPVQVYLGTSVKFDADSIGLNTATAEWRAQLSD